ncbi:fam-m protein [Plasmodium malariae]|uniref:Fam-m protein n=1 Tax=Plasmodium malariae TaxID=5858 RepID=A0A1D3JH84_PLAMA|nr:fam-m protein [Plasmodium malariae]SBT85663.1 fam-m protein [Plasmodium malariae]
MDKKVKLLLFIKIFTFILLTWICYFDSELCTYNKSIDKNYKHCKKFYTKSYRTLAKCKQNNNSNNVCLKEMLENNGVNNQRDISNNVKCREGKNKPSNRSLLNKAQYYVKIIDYNNGMFDGKHFHFEKKWIKKRDYDEFVEKKRKISDIALKKIKLRSYGFGVTIIFIFLFLGIGLAVLPKLPFLQVIWKTIEKASYFQSFKAAIESVERYVNNNLYILLYIVLMVILSVAVIIVIHKILRNNEKYTKMWLINE